MPKPLQPPDLPPPGFADWTHRTERGSRQMLRIMTWLSLHFGRRLSRAVLHSITLYYVLFAPVACRNSRAYLTRALGRRPTLGDVYRHILSFASTIHDRVFLLNGRYDLFDVSTEGEPLVKAVHDRKEGAFLMGAHLGSFEVTRAVGHQQSGLEVAMAMYADNARKINAALIAINPSLKTDIIEIGHMSAMLDIRSRLDAGNFVGMLGDRSPDNDDCQQVAFLGGIAAFPTGPMRAAAMMRRRVYFMAGFYLGANRYHVVFESLADFSDVGPADRAGAVRAAVDAFAATVERHCREYPYNWFNFFDFWKPRITKAKHA